MNIELFSAWNRTLGLISAREPCSQSIDDLLKSLELLVSGCNSMSILYPKGESAEITHSRLRANEDPKVQLEGYVNAAYLLDPFYTWATVEKKEGVFRLRDVTPTGFEDSEYFDLYYRKAQLEDEACFIFLLDNNITASVSVCRSNLSNEKKFSEYELDILSATFPMVKHIVSEYVAHSHEKEVSTIESRLDNALANFGTTLLTPKECEILQYILHGYSLKNIAQKLGNSIETIKYHRKNIYTKLDVSTQPEMFYLFIDSLRHLSSSSNSDPLENYFNRPDKK